MAQNSTAPRSQEDYITQVSEEIEGRVTKKLSQEFSKAENRILGALARLDDFLMNPLLQGLSGTTPETSRNVLSVNQGTNEDDSQSDPHPEAGLLTSGREDRHDMAMGVQRESTQAHDTLSSISSDTCVIYSSFNLGTDVFCDWTFLGCSSCVSLVTAANSHLFLNVAIFLKGKCYAVMKTELDFFVNELEIKQTKLSFRINN